MTLFSNKTKTIMKHTEQFAQERNAEAVTTAHLLYGIAENEDSFGAIVLKRFGITKDRLLEVLDGIAPSSSRTTIGIRPTPGLEAVYEKAGELAERTMSETIGSHHLLMAILCYPEGYPSLIFQQLMVNPIDILAEIFAAFPEDEKIASLQKELSERLSGSTEEHSGMFRELCINMNEMAAQGKYDEVYGREEEIRLITEILGRKKKNNACLVGEPGVGKTAIVEGLALQIQQGRVSGNLADKVIYALDLTTIVSGTRYRGDFEERMRAIIDEACARENVILFIDEIHTLIGTGAGENSLDAANMLKPALARGELQLIGATTYDEYKKYIETDGALERRFKPVRIEEPGPEATLKILEGLRETYEIFHGVRIPEELLKECVRMADRYVPDRYFPDKAIDLMDEASAHVASRGCNRNSESGYAPQRFADYNDRSARRIQWKEFIEKDLKRCHNNTVSHNERPPVTSDDLAYVVSKWTSIPVHNLTQSESQRLMRLGERLKHRIIAQDSAVDVLAKAMKRAGAGISNPNRPLGTFLFCGPSGVGKTELAKQLCIERFGSEQHLITIDMTEYMEKHSVSKIIGSPPGYVGYGEGGQLTERVRKQPYSIILFDEIEKAHPDVYNILLQIMDEGRIYDSSGRRVNFRNCTLIMTSNIGSTLFQNKRSLGFNEHQETADYDNMKQIIKEELQQRFRPEFMNRIDEIVIFKPLDKDALVRIAGLLIDEFGNHLKTVKNIDFKVTPAVKRTLADKAYDPKFGARALKRIIQTEIEDPVADLILEHAGTDIHGIRCSQKDKKLLFEINEGGNSE